MSGSASAKVSPYAKSKMFAGPPPLGDLSGDPGTDLGDAGGVVPWDRVVCAYARASSCAASASRLAASNAASVSTRVSFISRKISSAAARSSLASAASSRAASSSRRSCLTLSGVTLSGASGLNANSSSPGDARGVSARCPAGVGAGARGEAGADEDGSEDPGDPGRTGRSMTTGADACASGMDASVASAKSESSVPVPISERESSVPVPASERIRSFHDIDSWV